MEFRSRPVRGVLVSMPWVLPSYSHVDPDNVRAVQRLKDAGIGLRLLTTDNAVPVSEVAKNLQDKGFQVTEEDVFSPISAVVQMLERKGAAPYLVVDPKVQPAFSHLPRPSPPDVPATCVVVGDVGPEFTYDNMNKAFRALSRMRRPLLCSLSNGKSYQHLSPAGAFSKALEWAVDEVEVHVVGLKSSEFYDAAVASMGVAPKEVLMVSNDRKGVVLEVQKCGVTRVLVQKCMPVPIPKDLIIVSSLAMIVDEMLGPEECEGEEAA